MSFKRYRKKPVSVEAIKLTSENVREIAQICGGRIVEEVDPFDTSKKYVGLNYPTLTGNQRVSEGDFLVRNDRGEFTSFPASVFEVLYEEV